MGNVENILVGVPPDVKSDPRVQEQLGKIAKGIDNEAAEVVVNDPQLTLERYGIKLRILGIAAQVRLIRLVTLHPQIPNEYYPLIMLFSLAADEVDVYRAWMVAEKGLPEFMADVDRWFEAKNIPPKATGELMAGAARAMELTEKIMASSKEVEGKADVKKT